MGIPQMIKIVSILVIVLVIAGGLWYVTDLKANLAISQENSKKLESSITLQKELIESIRKDQDQIRKINDGMAEVIRKQNEEVNNLRDRFSRNAAGEERDIGKLAVEKPKLIENVINKASVKALRCLEIASGSPLTKDELNEKNSECPSLTGNSK